MPRNRSRASASLRLLRGSQSSLPPLRVSIDSFVRKQNSIVHHHPSAWGAAVIRKLVQEVSNKYFRSVKNDAQQLHIFEKRMAAVRPKGRGTALARRVLFFLARSLNLDRRVALKQLGFSVKELRNLVVTPS